MENSWMMSTKCGDITNKNLNAAIDAERTLKCKWPKGIDFEDKSVKTFGEIPVLL